MSDRSIYVVYGVNGAVRAYEDQQQAEEHAGRNGPMAYVRSLLLTPATSREQHHA